MNKSDASPEALLSAITLASILGLINELQSLLTTGIKIDEGDLTSIMQAVVKSCPSQFIVEVLQSLLPQEKSISSKSLSSVVKEVIESSGRKINYPTFEIFKFFLSEKREISSDDLNQLIIEAEQRRSLDTLVCLECYKSTQDIT